MTGLVTQSYPPQCIRGDLIMEHVIVGKFKLRRKIGTWPPFNGCAIILVEKLAIK